VSSHTIVDTPRPVAGRSSVHRRGLRRPICALILVAAVAGGARFWHLSHPSDLVFDEVYYPKAGCILIGWSNKTCMITSPDEKYWRTAKWDVGSWVHPPLGKWEVGLGIKAFGMRPFGWRVTTALEGTLVAVGVALIAQLLFGSALWTLVAGMLLALEGLNITMSRVGLLDTHLEFWIVAAFLFLVLDRRWIDRRTPLQAPVVRDHSIPAGFFPQPEPPKPPRVPSPIWRPWRFAAGIALGAAASVKWSGAMALIGAVVLTYAWETSRRMVGGRSRGRAFLRAVARETFGMTLAFLIIPATVFMATWIPWFHHFGWSLKAWWENQVATWKYHQSLKATAYDTKTKTYTPTHPYYSRPWSWLPMIRPVNMYASYPNGGVEQILGVGNAAIFWASFWALPFAAYAWRRMRDWRAGFVLVTSLALYLPWFLVSRPQFFFYVLPMTPFIVLADTYTLRWLSDATWIVHDPASGETIESTRHPYRPIVWGYMVLVALVFWWFYPIWTGGFLTTSGRTLRLWLRRWG
jgi:dolichyl-phosphate-mannose-protein mannosyltransferase